MNRRTIAFTGAAILLAGYFWAARPTGLRDAVVNPPAPSAPTTETPSTGVSAETGSTAKTGESRATDDPAARKDLERLLTRARASLPTIASMRGKTPEEVHETPTEIIDSGKRFGELAEFLEKHPSLVKEALPTYRECAADAKAMPAIRGLCTYRLHVYEKEWDAVTRAAYSKIPPEIRDLASHLDGT